MSNDEREPGDERQGRAFLEPERMATSVEIQMLDDERSRAEALIERNSWKGDEGLHIIFSRGLVALERETHAGLEFEGKRLIDMETPGERERFLFTRLNELESKYSVMKFTAFNALKANETLQMNVTGFNAEFRPLAEQNKYLREREVTLRARVAELEAQVRPAAPAPRRTRWQTLRLLVRELLT